jgi:hypothetical protein
MRGGTDGTKNATNDTNGEKTRKTIDFGERTTTRSQTTTRQKISNNTTNAKNEFFGDGGSHEDF